MEDPQTTAQALQDSQNFLTFLEFVNIGEGLGIIGFVINILNNTEKRIMDRITQIISAASATAPPGEIKELLESIARLLKAIANLTKQQ